MIAFEEGKKYVIIASEKMKRYGDNKVIIAEKTVDAAGHTAYKYEGNIYDPHITIGIELDGPLTVNGEFICENFIADCNVSFDSGYLRSQSDIDCGSNTIYAELIATLSIRAKIISAKKLSALFIRAKEIDVNIIEGNELHCDSLSFNTRLRLDEIHANSIKEGGGYAFPKIFAAGLFVDEVNAASTRIFASTLEARAVTAETLTVTNLKVEKDLWVNKIICETLKFSGKINKNTCFTGKQVK